MELQVLLASVEYHDLVALMETQELPDTQVFPDTLVQTEAMEQSERQGTADIQGFQDIQELTDRLVHLDIVDILESQGTHE